MVQIQIDVDDKLDKEIEIYKAINRIDNKASAVIKMLDEIVKVLKERKK